MAGAVERIVVQTTQQDKKAIVAKAKRLDLPVSELMRRGAFAYDIDESDAELAALADAAGQAADRAASAIDDALAFIEASNRRIAVMEARAAKPAASRKAP
jgi:hypothetical protein